MQNLLNLIIDKKCPICQADNDFADCLNCLSKLHDSMKPQYEDVNYKNATLKITFCNYRKLEKLYKG